MPADSRTDLNLLTIPALWTHLAGTGLVRRLIELARDEDLGAAGDVTAAVMGSRGGLLEANLMLRETGVVCGLAAGPLVCEVFGNRVEGRGGGQAEFESVSADGDRVAAGSVVGRLKGDRDAVVTIERTLLNLVGRLSGVATRTAAFVREVSESGAQIFDTRKTTPGLRMLEKYAVRCGGGRCHRLGLSDAVLIKDNHVAGLDLDGFASFVEQAASKAAAMRGAGHLRFVQVEVDSMDQLERVLGMERGLIDVVLLDNFDIPQLEASVRLRSAQNGRVQLEASGGIQLETVGRIAQTGVERISIGGLTHRAVSLDVGLDAGV